MTKERKQIIAVIILLIVLIGVIGGVTYSFFNYTRTGSANTLSVGRISFITRETDTFSISNAFPISRSTLTSDPTNSSIGTYVIEIQGDTDYEGGIEYLVTTENTTITTSSGTNIPIAIDVTVANLGTESNNYFTARDTTNASIYQKLVGNSIIGNQRLLVGYIVPNPTPGTATGINGSITIKAFFDEAEIAVTDTYDGTESAQMGTTNEWVNGRTVLTTTEWNSLTSNGISFKVKVEANEGIWVNDTLNNLMRVKNINTTTNQPIRDDQNSTYVQNSTPGINFGAISSDTNGKGIYMRAGTQNTSYPILYYRGAVDDNNVLFANKCWKAVRTTDTGGVKLIYNGEQIGNKRTLQENEYDVITNTGDSYVFDSSNSRWSITTDTASTSSSPYELSFKVQSIENLTLKVDVSASSYGGVTLNLYKGSTSVSNKYINSNGSDTILYSYGAVTQDDVIKVSFYGYTSSGYPTTVTVKGMVADDTLGMGCDNSGTATQITLNDSGTLQNTFKFGYSYYSLAYIGYMYDEAYVRNTRTIFNANNLTMKYGSGFEYNNDNGTYTLTGTGNGIANTRHYTCFTTSETCDGADLGKIYYVYYKSGTSYYHIILQDGKSVEDALSEMQMNTNNSIAKDKIDDWYLANMTTYTSKLEDTIWCNDRSFNTQTNGWISNGGNVAEAMYFSPYGRSSQTPYTTRNPSLKCQKKNDSFTVSNNVGNKNLIHPVGLLTVDEMMLAGGMDGYSNKNYYLVTGNPWWTMSPKNFHSSPAVYGIQGDGNITSYSSDQENIVGLRPAISLKIDSEIISGNGTVSSPYVIKD